MSRKVPWEEKYERILKQFPSVQHVNWSAVMQDDGDVFARLLGDVLKSEGRGSKPGKRPQLERSEALSRLSKLSGEDFSEHDFHTSFKNLCTGMSVRHVASKTGLGKSYVQRLLTGAATPSFEVMEQIATAFKKKPSFFLEYRIAQVLVIVNDLLTDSPETATSWYLKLKGRKV